MDKILNSEEAGSLLNVSKKLIEDQARKKKLPGFKIGREWRFFEDQLLAALAEMGKKNLGQSQVVEHQIIFKPAKNTFYQVK